VNGTSAVLNGVADAKGGGQYWFEWGTTDSLGKRTTKVGVAYEEDVSAYIDGLKPETLYYFRVNAQNKFGVKRGNTFVFRTGSADSVSGSNGSTGANGTNGSGSSDGSNGNGSGGASANGDSPQTVVEVRNNATIIDGTIPAGKPVTAWFEYGPTNRLGSKTEDQSFDGKKDYVFSDTLYNLEENATYYAQPVYEVDGEVIRGEMISFSTDPNAKRGQGATGVNDGGLGGLLGGLLGGDTGSGAGEGSVAAAGGGLAGLLGGRGDGSGNGEVDSAAVRKNLEEKLLGARVASDSLGWGSYLQDRFFSVSGDAAVFGFAATQFKPYTSQKASAADSGSLLPNSLLDWLILIVVLFILIALGRRVSLAYDERKQRFSEQKKEQQEQKEIEAAAAV
jgi:hypothetical protein